MRASWMRWLLDARVLYGGMLCVLLLGACHSNGRDLAPRHLLLISIDTLRADRLGSYGYARPTSPTLDALATRGVRFETVLAESGWTLPSHVTLFTGLAPAVHGVNGPGKRLSELIPVLPEMLREHGFRTFAATGGAFLEPRYGFDRGFEAFAGALALPDALAWTRERVSEVGPDERFFAFVHTYEVHCPYDPPAAYAERFATRPASDRVETPGRCGRSHFNEMALTPGQARFLSDRYDASIRYADDQLGAFLSELSERGVLDETLVVVLSDHGEEFFEHGRIGHDETLFLEVLRIPWILVGPGLAPRVVREPAGLSDVLPVLLELLRVDVPEVSTSPIADLLAGRGAETPVSSRFSQNRWGAAIDSVVSGAHHVIHRAEPAGLWVFDWRADPAEAENLAGADAELDRRLQLELYTSITRNRAARQQQPRAEPVAVPDAGAEERLRALGYVH